MDSAVDGRDTDKAVVMLQLDPSDNLFWQSMVLQSIGLDIGIRWCILQALMQMTGFPVLLVERLCSQRVLYRFGQQRPHCGEVHARWLTYSS